MGRFRSFVRKVAKPAAMVAVAGTLAVSLTITTTQKAEASPIAALPVIAAAESILGGASLPLVMPSMAATVLAVTPVGWVIAGGVAVAGLVIGAYYTKDYWLPWVQGTFGAATGNANTPAPAGVNVDPNVSLTSVVKSSGTVATVTMSITNITNSTQKNYGLSASLKCTANADGTGTQYALDKKSPYTSYSTTYNNPAPTLNIACTYGYLQGIEVGAYGADPDLTASPGSMPGPTNVLRWGTSVTNGGGFDPKGSDVKYKTTVECIDNNGAKSTISADWLGSDGGAKFPSCAAAGKGHGTGVNKVEGYAPTAPGTPGTVPETIWSTAAPAVDPNYKQCDQGKPGPGCEMKILIDGKPCVVGQWECVNWSDLWKDSTTSARVGCTMGPYTLSPDACSIMEPAYRPGGGPLTDANTDGNPSTRNNTDLSGQPFTPETKPSTVPGAAGAPSPSGDQAMYDCWPQGWGVFNPADWVAKPLRCAFEPKQDLAARSAALTAKAQGKAPISFIVAPPMTGPASSGCPAWNISIPGVMSKNVVCDSSFTAAIVAIRGPLFGLVATAMCWPLLRSLWYAAIPILRVTPSSGGK